jgi:ketosteroid isomerase-like protein
VMDTEIAFARTMAERDHAAFTRYLSDEAVFFAGEIPTSGRDAVAAAWKPFFAEARAPFSWAPDRVEVLASGTLALSTGPVYDAGGRVVGRFNSIWRQEGPAAGRWYSTRGAQSAPPRSQRPTDLRGAPCPRTIRSTTSSCLPGIRSG